MKFRSGFIKKGLTFSTDGSCKSTVMQVFMRAAFGMSEIPELRVRQGFLEEFFPWPRRITWYLYLSLMVILALLGFYSECLDYPLMTTLANGKKVETPFPLCECIYVHLRGSFAQSFVVAKTIKLCLMYYAYMS